jgi:CelD/BcsL family acetyltransferase involved in cellulose biosynthesis
MNHELIVGKDALNQVREEWDGLWAKSSQKIFDTYFDVVYSQVHWYRLGPEEFVLVRFKDKGETVALCPLAISRRGSLPGLRSLDILRTRHTAQSACLVLDGYHEQVGRSLADIMCRNFPLPYHVITLDLMSPTDSLMVELIKGLRARTAVQWYTRFSPNVVIRIDPGTTAEELYLGKNRKLRANLRREIKLLGKDFWWDVVICRQPGPQLDQAIEFFLEVNNKAWQEVRDPDYYRRYIPRMAERGVLNLFTVVIRPGIKVAESDLPLGTYDADLRADQPFPEDCQPIAAALTFRMGEKVRLCRTAFDQDYRKYSPGNVLLWFTLKYYLEQGGAESFDFEFGDEDYKMKWGELNEYRYVFQAAPWRSGRGIIEVLGQKYFLPFIRRTRAKLKKKK